MATASDTLTAAGQSLTLNPSASGRADNLATFVVTGTWSGLTLRCWVSDDGTHFVLAGAYNDAGKVWESQTLTAGFAVPDSTGSSWQVPCANRSAVKFEVVTVGTVASIAIRADSSFQFGESPAGPPTVYDPVTGSAAAAVAATADAVSPRNVPLVGLGVWNAGQGVYERLQGDGSGVTQVAVEATDRAYSGLIYAELYRTRKLWELVFNQNLDDVLPPEGL